MCFYSRNPFLRLLFIKKLVYKTTYFDFLFLRNQNNRWTVLPRDYGGNFMMAYVFKCDCSLCDLFIDSKIILSSRKYFNRRKKNIVGSRKISLFRPCAEARHWERRSNFQILKTLKEVSGKLWICVYKQI